MHDKMKHSKQMWTTIVCLLVELNINEMNLVLSFVVLTDGACTQIFTQS